MISSTPFSPADLNRIETAVAAAEDGTSGEIVPVFVEASGSYGEAAWRVGIVAAFCGGLVSFLALAATGTERELPAWIPTLIGAICFVAGFFAGHFLGALVRLFTPDPVMNAQVSLHAEASFTREQVFLTRDRTGILIFVSLLERKVRVLADAGIHSKVPPGTWDGVVAKVVSGMKTGRSADGIVEAVELCGQLLRQHGFVARSDDTNELGNALRVEG